MEQKTAQLIHSKIVGCTTITPKNSTDFSLDELYKLIGCDKVELLTVYGVRAGNEPCYLIFDEEGRFKDNLCLNRYASVLAGITIVGDAILCPRSMFI